MIDNPKVPHYFVFCQTRKQGADPILFTALSPSLEGVGGKYIINSAMRNSSQLSYDIIIQDKLWTYTKDLIKTKSWLNYINILSLHTSERPVEVCVHVAELIINKEQTLTSISCIPVCHAYSHCIYVYILIVFVRNKNNDLQYPILLNLLTVLNSPIKLEN